ncbi:hypothetical protein ACFOND_06745 [Reinekea marina]|uniref:DUF3995 domain-containing protein n=2 Tax=Reinekea marina TaxID=1310421 RepID=A0ABV7WPW0_9GAMM
MNANIYLLAAAGLCGLAALAHLGCIVFGGDWYRFFGAGEGMATMAEQGLWYPTILTTGLVAILSIWSLYALSGAGVITSLPFTRLALIAIATVFFLRGLFFFALMPAFPENSLQFWLISSAICLSIGGLISVGVIQRWHFL